MILLEGEFSEAWTKGDNSQIVATETQKNTLYALAKKYSVDPIEVFAFIFLSSSRNGQSSLPRTL